jgi:holliday junction DNA helicase RuvA
MAGGRMIALLKGTIVEKQPNRLVVDVHGVGYEVQVPLSTFYQLPDQGGEVLLRIHTHVREDVLALFGFMTTLEQQIFERLIAISGIGPRLAIAVLSGIDAHDLVRAVQLGDTARLTTIPGIGRKTAERITLELKDRLARLAIAVPAEAGDAARGGESLRGDLLSALLNLGYHRPLAERAVEAALKASGDDSFEARLKIALRQLAR